jgi:xanthine dehydrogenase molybdenum-binding subunit
MLYAAPRLSDYPRAILKGIDPTPALAIPGVVKVITASDVPGERYQGLIEKDWPVFVAVDECTRYMGDMIAVVVADRMETARQGARALKVDYEVLEPVCSPHAALEERAPAIHPKGNLLSRSIIRRGDAESALRESAFVAEESFQTQCIEHLFLEPESCVAAPTVQGGLHIYSQGQGVFDDRRQIAGVLGWDLARIEVELVPCGGAFGGREDLSVQAQTAWRRYCVTGP